ncbi:polysaccharide biosynthesis protein [Paenibacillus sp. IB182496]|uniref:Polysaccharide biosynthesis protein n=1 Tax=Paenibacillus sabuli TaxID=2772509 RepID=A0A927GS13_9BACL|nr:SDR family NAD(P)-dependent oxidoreductase [Paenibacillus sabuli]MBD2845821.1 polysaccharide biosynthesis protein [Paenibacillus sabuli]
MYFKNKKILIIGGTGTIGQMLVNRLMSEQPEVIRVFSRDEHKQYEMQQKWMSNKNIRFLIGDVRDYERLKRAMQDIHYVFHVAAMKHVPACEYNPFEAVQTNVIGTQNVIQAAMECGVERVLFTSSDKAIAPTNTYGASKLMAERLISAAQYYGGGSKTIFSAVRFGNVLGSRGSVIPLFQEQILHHREITITEKDMSRFMMTSRQAVDLTLEALKYAKGGEVFVLKMPVIRLMDLVDCVIEEMAKRLNINVHDIRIKEMGLRPGEKRFEELMTEDEAFDAQELPNMYIIPNAFVRGNTDRYVGASKITSNHYNSKYSKPINKERVRELLKETISFETQFNYYQNVIY